MPQIVKINDFTKSDTTENTYGKFQKAHFKKLVKLEDINKNGYIKMEYDINDKPYLKITADKSSTIITNNSIQSTSGNFDQLSVKSKNIESIFKKMDMKIKYLEEKIKDLESLDKIVEKNISEDTSDILYLIEFNNPRIGLYGLFTLNDNCQYLYMCFKIDKNISYWKLINRITD